MSVHSSTWTQIFITSCFHRPLKPLYLESQNSPKRSEKSQHWTPLLVLYHSAGQLVPAEDCLGAFWTSKKKQLNFFFYFLEMFKSANNSSCSLLRMLLYLLAALQLALSSIHKEMNTFIFLNFFREQMHFSNGRILGRVTVCWAYCRLIPMFRMYILPRPSRLCKLRIYPQETFRLLLLFPYKSVWLTGTGKE
jgi:hypothetical protein